MHMKSRQKARKDNICNFDWLIGGGAPTILTARQAKRAETYQYIYTLLGWSSQLTALLTCWQNLITKDGKKTNQSLHHLHHLLQIKFNLFNYWNAVGVSAHLSTWWWCMLQFLNKLCLYCVWKLGVSLNLTCDSFPSQSHKDTIGSHILNSGKWQVRTSTSCDPKTITEMRKYFQIKI